jgi:hypothetical protein
MSETCKSPANEITLVKPSQEYFPELTARIVLPLSLSAGKERPVHDLEIEGILEKFAVLQGGNKPVRVGIYLAITQYGWTSLSTEKPGRLEKSSGAVV